MTSPEEVNMELKNRDTPTNNITNHASDKDAKAKKLFKRPRPTINFRGVARGVMIGQHIENTFNMKKKTGEVVEEIPTDCYGDINFKETTRQSAGKFVRISDETNVKALFDFMTDEDPGRGWGLEKPRLLISVTGGAKSFIIDPRLKKDFQDGLAKVANTPGAWIVSGGTNTGVMKMVGDANYGTGNTCIGIATWGTISEKEAVTHGEGKPRRYDYHLGSYLVQDSSAFLDYNHSHFLLVDDGTEGEYGGEIEFRGKFEDLISKAKVPTVLLVLNGGIGTLRTVYNTSVSNEIPCVIIKGSGGVADLLAYALMAEEEIKQSTEENKHKGLLKETEGIAKKKDVSDFYDLVLKCLEKSQIFTIAEFDSDMDTDDAILTALLHDDKSSPSHYEQIRLTIIWDRPDLADSKVLAPLLKWKPEEGRTEEEEFNKLMIMALAMNRKDFVKLLLDYGVSVKRALTKQVLEFLYYCYGASLKRADMTADPMRIDEPQEYKEFFADLLCYNAVGAGQTGRKKGDVEFYRLNEIQDRLCEMLDRVPDSHIKSLMEIETPSGTFEDPFRQLFIWAVMNNLLDMALFFWEFLDETIATALIASEIIHDMMNDTRFKELNGTEEGSLEDTFNTFSQLAIDLMDSCYKANEEETEIIVTKRSTLFDEKSSCLEFAVATEQEDFVAHPAIQGLLDEVWYGSIKATDTSQWMIFATIFCPLLLLNMEIRSKGEIDKMNEGDSEEHAHEHSSFKYRVGAKKRKAKYQHLGKNTTSLPFWWKFVNFHLYSPVVRFFEHTIGYVLFLMLLTYVAMLKKTSTTPGWTEILVAVTVFGLLVQELYQIFHVDTSATIKSRLLGYLWDVWNLFDLLCIAVFILALILRSYKETIGISHFFYGVDASLWIVRLIHALYVDTVAGPYVVMIGQMIGDMFKFLIILAIFLLSYGVGVKAFLNPSPDSAQMFIQTIFHPYFHIHGEYFLDDPSNDTTMLGTPKTNNWQEPLALFYMAVYLLITNILLLNLLIAIFNNTYERVISNSSRIWKYRRYALVVEYAERRTFLCSPFSLIQHIFIFFWIWLSKCCPTCIPPHTLDSGLKQKRILEPDRQLALLEYERRCCIHTMKKRVDQNEDSGNLDISGVGKDVMKKDEMDNQFSRLEQKISDLISEIRQDMLKKQT